ncbi:MAG: hypothetical protein HQ546_08320, partial [Planctomycetes bacterium]|nr:hypothetical protein [Planctomycetota bacterium]
MAEKKNLEIIDANCALGHVPGKGCGARTAEELLAIMDRVGIDKALVYSWEACKENRRRG